MANIPTRTLYLASETPYVVSDGLDWDSVFVDLNLILSHSEPEQDGARSHSCPLEFAGTPFRQDDQLKTYQNDSFPWSSEPFNVDVNYNAVHSDQHSMHPGKYTKTTITRPSQLSLCTMPSSPAGLEVRRVNTESISHQHHDSDDELVSLSPSPDPDLVPANAGLARTTSPDRALVLYKRKLRNRQSAKRSRQRRMVLISDLLLDIKALREDSEQVRVTCELVVRENQRLKQQLGMTQNDAN
mmetsp:Transcript_1520/g.2521  ORF Transcript_1520/g.2521 Transcript_1520/m.2521 type:complete len:242 (+) Transcript_1520:118-843(+)